MCFGLFCISFGYRVFKVRILSDLNGMLMEIINFIAMINLLVSVVS